MTSDLDSNFSFGLNEDDLEVTDGEDDEYEPPKRKGNKGRDGAGPSRVAGGKRYNP